MEDPLPQTNENKKELPMNWIIAVIVLVLIIWMIYSASQTAKVKTDNNSMPGMTMPAQATATMPANMPGMNHG